jgi:hypothetical protein
MRACSSVFLILCLALGAVGHAQAPGGDAAAILAAAREALGGEKKLSAVKSFEATGRTRQVRGINLVPIEFEMYCELPERYVRIDEVPAQETGPTSTGFSGDSLIQYPPPPEPPPQAARPPGAPGAGAPPAASAPGAAARPGAPGSPAPAPPAAAPGTPGAPPAPPTPAASAGAVGGAPSGAAGAAGAPPAGGTTTAGVPQRGAPGMPGAGGPPAAPVDPSRARVMMAKQEFVKLTLGMFATSLPTYPVTFTFAGLAEAPQGKADIIDVKGPGTFALKLFINDETHLPIMVSWTTPAANVILDVPGVPKPEVIPPGSIIVAAPAPPPETASKDEVAAYGKTLQDLRKKALTGAKPVENRLYFADYRDIGNGIKFPFRLRKAIAGETIEETNFDGFKTNSRIDPRKFQGVRK